MLLVIMAWHTYQVMPNVIDVPGPYCGQIHPMVMPSYLFTRGLYLFSSFLVSSSLDWCIQYHGFCLLWFGPQQHIRGEVLLVISQFTLSLLSTTMLYVWLHSMWPEWCILSSWCLYFLNHLKVISLPLRASVAVSKLHYIPASTWGWCSFGNVMLWLASEVNWLVCHYFLVMHFVARLNQHFVC